MIPIVTAEQMRALDQRTITEALVPSLTLMERAGAGVVTHLEARYAPLAGKSVIILCGKGNNGGDGFVVGRLLRRKQAQVHILLLASPEDLSRDAKTMYQRFLRSAGKSAVTCPADVETIQQRLATGDILVDAILGTGLSTPVTGLYRDAIEAIGSRLMLLTDTAARAALPPRRPSAHKGTYGHLGVIAGSVGKTGAAAMAALSALRIGTGLVTAAIPSSANDILEAKLLEVMTLPMPETKARTFARSGLDRLLAFAGARDAVAIGPGLTTHPETVDLVQELVKRIDKPCVLDADALNALAGKSSLLTECKRPPIITPHPGEMARLETEATTQSVNEDRLGTATRFARERGVFVILKGARTVIARPDGLAAICPTGNPGMATAGTGDVLTGMVGGLLAQGLAPWDAACAATYFHGLAGDLAAQHLGQAGMIASDLIQHIPHALAPTTHT